VASLAKNRRVRGERAVSEATAGSGARTSAGSDTKAPAADVDTGSRLRR
jgi:hypothetical protein